MSTALSLYLLDLQTHNNRFLDVESREKFERIIFDMSASNEDEMSDDIDDAIKKIENIARPNLTR